MNEEFLDIVNQNDQVIDTLSRNEVYAKNLINFRAIDAFLINDQGQLWIPRRTKTKRVCPLTLDASMSGHVSAGESYDQAFVRELQEELNLDADSLKYTMIGSMTPHQHNTIGFLQVYTIHTNQEPDYNPDDFCEAFWLSPQELIEKLAAGDQGKDNLIIIMRHFFINPT